MLLKEWRWKAGFNQAELAERLGVSQPEVSRVENGGHASLRLRRRFREEFGADVDVVEEFQLKEEHVGAHQD